MATPREPQQFIALKNTIPDDEARAAFSLIQTKPLKPSMGIPADVEELRRKVLKLEAKIESIVNLRSEDIRRRWNPMIDRVELEVGDIRDSNPKTSLVLNGGFDLWNTTVTLPIAWTATNAPTISRVTRRTGAQGGNYAVRIASGGSAGSISQIVNVKGGAVYRLAGWVYLGDSDTTATITLTDNGGTPVVVALTLDGARDGVAGWFSFPRYGFDGLSIETASDATTVTIKLEASINDTVDFSDFQMVQGPQADPDLWERGNDRAQASSYTPAGTGVLNITSVTPGTFYFTVLGDQVHVWGDVVVDPVAAGATTYRLSLPVVSNIGATSDAVGFTCHGQVAGLVGTVEGVAATDDVLVGFVGPDGTQRTYKVTFDYRII